MLPSATLSWSLGTPNNPSFVPSFWLYYSDAMSFTQRLFNAAMTWAEIVSSDLMHRHADQKALDELYTYPGHRDCPPLSALTDALSLTLVNSHFSVSYARPYPPNVVSVAGMHMRPQSSAVDVDRVRILYIIFLSNFSRLYYQMICDLSSFASFVFLVINAYILQVLWFKRKKKTTHKIIELLFDEWLLTKTIVNMLVII